MSLHQNHTQAQPSDPSLPPKTGTVYLIAQPTIPRRPGAKGFNLSALSEWGEVKVLVHAGEYPTFHPGKCWRLVVERLADFNPHHDYLVWAGGDTLSAVMAGAALADLAYDKGWEEFMWLRVDRPRGPDGRRQDELAKYRPVRVYLGPTSIAPLDDHEADVEEDDDEDS